MPTPISILTNQISSLTQIKPLWGFGVLGFWGLLVAKVELAARGSTVEKYSSEGTRI